MNTNTMISAFNLVLNTLGITPEVWEKKSVENLIYLVLPFGDLVAKARTGKNTRDVSIVFKGGFISTRTKVDGSGRATHCSSPFIKFLSELPRTDEVGEFIRKPGEIQVYAPTGVNREKTGDGVTCWAIDNMEEVRWRHVITEGEVTSNLAEGDRIPYNFELEFSNQQLLNVTGGTESFSGMWADLKEFLLKANPQLHVILSVSPEAHKEAENKEVYGVGCMAYHLKLRPSEILHVKWVTPEDKLYDKAATLPETPVDHRAEFEKVRKGPAKPMTVGEVKGLSDPYGTLRKKWIKALNTVQFDYGQLNEFLDGLYGNLEYFWENLPEDKRQKYYNELKECKRNSKGEKKYQEQQRKAPKTAQPKPDIKGVVAKEMAKPDVGKEEEDWMVELDALLNAPISPPAPSDTDTSSSPFSGMSVDDDFDWDLPVL